ncbi:MAG: hypothetical protein GY827_09885 [Cytophagales bacterium]|nr:hypothetical protein [Cytophagales bacterium]
MKKIIPSLFILILCISCGKTYECTTVTQNPLTEEVTTSVHILENAQLSDAEYYEQVNDNTNCIEEGEEETNGFADCNGDIDGNAYTDNCGECVGGNTGIAPCNEVISETGTTVDIDGNAYKTVTIDGRTWMAENLRTTRYNDGTSIELSTIDNTKSYEIGTRSYYSDNVSNASTYGALYNQVTVNTGKLCPIGWHVATADEWENLRTATGSNGYDLKSTNNWGNGASGSNNLQFNAVPGGYAYHNGTSINYYSLGQNAYWISSTSSRLYYISSNHSFTFLSSNNRYSLSVRCVHDDEVVAKIK